MNQQIYDHGWLAGVNLASGALFWQKTISGSSPNTPDRAASVAAIDGGDVLFTFSSFDTGGLGYIVAGRVHAASGAVLWQRSYRTPGGEQRPEA